METVEQEWNRPADEREALIARARAWGGTQREFAAAHGVSQSTVSKWQNAVGPRSYTTEDRAAVVEGFASFEGSQREHDDALGLPRGTTGKWVCQSGAGRRGRRPPLALRLRNPPPAPTFLEVVPVEPAAPMATVPARSSGAETAAARLVLGDGVALVFDTLPPASWVADLAAGLSRC
ncbi:MAG: helix-turn-helix domain-containing protein [Candidatus Deferrimicrobiota bacterium]